MVVCTCGTWWLMRQCDRQDVQWRAIRIGRLTVMAEHVIGGSERAARWMAEAQPMLGGRSPVEMANSDAETKEVERLLYAIADGLPA